MNIDKQIWEIIYKHVDPFRKKDDEPIEDFVVYCDNDCFNEMIPQIKKTILKAIMENEEPRLYDENSDSYYVNLSVIKDLLSPKQSK